MIDAGTRADLAGLFRLNRTDVIHEALTKIDSISDGRFEELDPAYVTELPKTVATVFDYVVDSMESSEERLPPTPVQVLTQTRLAALSGMTLGTVIRRCTAVSSVIHMHAVGAAVTVSGSVGVIVEDLTRRQVLISDQIARDVTEEYNREIERCSASITARRAQTLRGLLAGEAQDTQRLSYDFESSHLGMVADGPADGKVWQAFGEALGARVLKASPNDKRQWVWFAVRRGLQDADVESATAQLWPPNQPLGIGSCLKGIAGWRRTHAEALGAYTVATKSRSTVVYRDVARDVSMMKDPLLADFLVRTYIQPVVRGSTGRVKFLDTVQAYIDAGRSAASAAAVLGVSRQTVCNRLRAIEAIFGRSLEQCASDLEAAIRLDRLGSLPEL